MSHDTDTTPLGKTAPEADRTRTPDLGTDADTDRTDLTERDDSESRTDRTGWTDRAADAADADADRPDRAASTDPDEPGAPLSGTGPGRSALGDGATTPTTPTTTAATATPTTTAATTATTATTADHEDAAAGLLADGSGEQLTERLQQAVGMFVDDPRQAVEAADGVLEEAVRRLTDSLAQRREALRQDWQHDGSTGTNAGANAGTPATGRASGPSGTTATGDADTHTEGLRLTLRQYRDLVQHLLAA